MPREYMNLPVPVEFLTQMTLHLADLERGLPTTIGGVADQQEVEPDPETGSQGTVRRKAGVVWTPDQWANLHHKGTVSSIRVFQFANKLPVGEEAAKPLSELAKLAGITDNELRAALSWLTRYIRKTPQVYPTDSWPFGWKVGKQVDPANPFEFHYWISEEQKATVIDGIEQWLDEE